MKDLTIILENKKQKINTLTEFYRTQGEFKITIL